MTLLRDGSYRLIIRVGGSNLEMKKKIEKAGIVRVLGELVESWSAYSIFQIYIHCKQLDSEAHARRLQPYLNDTSIPEPIRKLARAHLEHFEQKIKQENLLQREYYIVIPFGGTDTPLVGDGVVDQIPGARMFKVFTARTERNLKNHQPTNVEVATARAQLSLEAERIEARLSQMGIWHRRLDDLAARQLFFECYHPSLAERKGLLEPHEHERRLSENQRTRRRPRPREITGGGLS